MAQVFDRELAADGVDSSHYGTLSLIGAFGPLRLTEVASELGLPLTTASDVVRRLEARGHVRRTPNPDDGRSFLFELTARGDREWKRGWGALQRIAEGLDVDQDEMRDALTRLNAAFDRLLTDG
jgi:DNA-binding MarR family transcriptional regulator